MIKRHTTIFQYLLISLLLMFLLPAVQADISVPSENAASAQQTDCHSAAMTEAASSVSHCTQDACLCTFSSCQLSMLLPLQQTLPATTFSARQLTAPMASVLSPPPATFERPPKS